MKRTINYDDETTFEGIKLYLETEHHEDVAEDLETQREYGGIYIASVYVTNPLNSKVVNTLSECNLVDISKIIYETSVDYYSDCIHKGKSSYLYYTNLDCYKVFSEQDQEDLLNISGTICEIEEQLECEFSCDPPDDYDDRDYF
tara:strand:+ start:9630 stop:10061 length:432 start_codon:yes stop_codon:yes gene_type:complete